MRVRLALAGVPGAAAASASQSSTASAAASGGSASQINPLLESIINLRNASRSQPAMQMNHTLQRTFGGPLEASFSNYLGFHFFRSVFTFLGCFPLSRLFHGFGCLGPGKSHAGWAGFVFSWLA